MWDPGPGLFDCQAKFLHTMRLKYKDNSLTHDLSNLPFDVIQENPMI